MAFEDRSSPNTASSPCSENSLNLNSPNSPESTRTSPYTCTTIPHQNEGNRTHSFTQKEHTFFSITSYALSSPKFPNLTAQKFQPPNDQKNSFLSRIDFLRAHEFRLANDCTTAIPKIPNESTSKSPNPLLSSPSTDSTVSYNRSDNSNSPPPRNEDEVAADTLKYSIRNILQPEFGKNAVIRTKIFKPYENPDDQPTAPPLGSLCQTVSQIGKATCTTRPTTPLAKTSFAEESKEEGKVPQLWPAWVYCTRYSDRPSSGPRSRRMKKPGGKPATEDKRPRTAFSGVQLARLKHEFTENRYLTERRRQQLSQELGLNEAQIKIWFQNKRAKIKKSSGQKNPLALQLMAQGLYNHSTVACDEDEMSISA